jgi:hypothetical protein
VEESNPLFFEVMVAKMPKWIPDAFLISRFGVSKCSGRERLVSFEVAVAEMATGRFSHFAFRGFEMQWKSNPFVL